MKHKFFSVMILLVFCTVSFAVTLKKSEKVWTVEGAAYTVMFEKGNSYIARFTKIGGKGVHWTTVTPRLLLNREISEYQKAYNSGDQAVNRKAMGLKPEVLQETPEKIVLRFSGKFPGGTVSETLEFDQTEVIRYDISIQNNGVYLSRFELSTGLNLRDDGGMFYPDRKRVPGTWMENGALLEGPGWKYAWFENSGVGLGLILPPGKAAAGLEYCMQNRKEGWNSDYAGIRAVFSPLRKYGKNGNFQFRCALIAGGTPEKAQTFADQILGKQEKPYLFSFMTEKLMVRPGEENGLIADLRNPGKSAAKVQLSVRMTYGLDSGKRVFHQPFELAAGEQKRIRIPVSYPKDAKHGISYCAELSTGAGALLDRKLEVSSVTDFAPRDSAFAIINSEMCNQDGSHEAWNNGLKQNYVGVCGYYCWAPSVIFGLAPEEESWSPHTATTYSKRIKKSFLKDLLSSARGKGVHIYSWQSPALNYKFAYQHPDWICYTQDGQPLIYNGDFRRNGERRCVIKPNLYTPARAAVWGNEFADSVEMFGWEGGYHGHSFVPSPPEKPEEDWFDHAGRSSLECYPDPERSGIRSLNAWKKAISARYPNVVYGHIYPNAKMWEKFPDYAAAACSDSIVLMGDMISGYLDRWQTYREWTAELSRRDDKVRKEKGTSAMGPVTVKPSHSEAYHLANYAAASSGLKCWGSNSQHLGERSGERNRYLMRFAEYYFGHDFRLPEEMPVEQLSGGDLLFEPFVRQRVVKSWKEIAVPMVNVGNGDIVSAFRNESGPRKNISFRLKDSHPEEAWLMTPQNPEKAVKLVIKDGVISIPELCDAALLLIRCKK